MTYSFHPAGYSDFRLLAQKRLPRFLFDYIDGGANREETLAANSADFQHWSLRQRVLHDVSALSTQSQLLGQEASMPVALAPLGMAGLYARRGEVQAARAAAQAGVPFSLSSVGICTVEEVNRATDTPCWFQLYMLKDREAVLRTLKRAEQAGCTTLLFTVDLPVAGARWRDTRNGMLEAGALGKWAKLRQILPKPHWLYEVGIKGRPHRFGNLADNLANPDDINAFKAWLDAQFDRSVTWQDIIWVRQHWRGKLVIKGILDGEDALRARDFGADAIVLSNHGGRQLDGVPSTISQLPKVAQALTGSVPILLDGGLRNGIDVLRALALGAQGVLIGRPWAFALAGAGQAGVENYLAQLKQELEIGMALCGVNRISDISADLLVAT